MRMLVWPVKFNRLVGESAECLVLLGVASSSSLEEVLALESRWRGLWPVAGVDMAIEFLFGLGVQPSVGAALVGELRRWASLVRSVGMAEMVLRSPTVSSCTVWSRPRVKSMSMVSPSGAFSLLFSWIVLMSSFKAVLLIVVLVMELFLDGASCSMTPMALVRPSLKRRVACAGDSGGESMATGSSCSRYFSGDRFAGEMRCLVGLSSCKGARGKAGVW